MKKIIIFLFIVFTQGYTASARNGFYLQPEVGIGFSSVKLQRAPFFNFRYYSPPRNIITPRVALKFGYTKGYLSINTGIAYLKTGYKIDKVYNDFAISYYNNFKQNFYHIVIPVVASYSISIARNWRFVPGIGGAYSINLGSHTSYTDFSGAKQNAAMDKNTFNTLYQQNNLWGIVQGVFARQLNRRIKFTIGPEVMYMLSSMLKDNNNNFQKNYSFTLNAGIMLNI